MSRYGQVTHAHGGAADLLASGRWLPRLAAARVLGLTPRQLDRAVADGEIRSRVVGPSARLFEVRR